MISSNLNTLVPNEIQFDWKNKVISSLLNGYGGNKIFYNVFLVNLWTIIRNCLKHGETSDLFNRVMMDCQQLYDNFLYRDSNDQPFNKLVCFYLPQEYNIPSIFQKSNNIETGKIVKYVRHMYDGLVPTIKETRTYNNSIYLEFVKFPSNAELSMHNVIWKHLCDKQSLIGSINDVRQPINILMLSHMTFDWFLCQTSLAHVQYLESYTGRIYCSDELISKILPKDIVISYPDIVKYIPFNTITHLLFGDKHLVKGLLSKKEQRTIILVLLEKYAHDLYRWVRDMNTLFSDLQQYLNISPLTLMTIKNQGGYN